LLSLNSLSESSLITGPSSKFAELNLEDCLILLDGIGGNKGTTFGGVEKLELLILLFFEFELCGLDEIVTPPY
jgi:hypothetical protein